MRSHAVVRSFGRALAAGIAALLAGGSLPAQRAAPNPERPGPWDFDLVLLESDDGLRWREKGPFVERAGVPTLLGDRQGRLIALFQWFPEGNLEAFDRVAFSRSEDQGRNWSLPAPITVEGMPKSLRRPFDPTLVELDDGRYRLYFTSHEVGEAREPAPGKAYWPRIHSAISKDGANYTFEPGERFAVEGEMVIDCAAAFWNGEWHLFAPVQGWPGSAYHATSKDGLAFERRGDLHVDTRGSWLGCAVAASDGLHFYGSGGSGWCAISRDALSWRLAPDTVRPVGMDPGVARLKDGSWLMVATGEMRPEARERAARRPREAAPRNNPPRELGGREPFPRADQGAITANDKFVYVLRNGILFKLDAESLVVLKSVRLPDDVEPADPASLEPPRPREE